MRFNRIFLLLLCATLCFGGCRVAASPSVAKGEQDFIGDLVFLGDSTTAHMARRAKLPKGERQVWGTRNRYYNLDAHITYTKIILPETGEELTVADAVAKTKPPFLVITLGVDYGVYYYRKNLEKFRFYYEKLLDAITKSSPDTVVVLQSIFPVARESAVITNEMIDCANAVVADIAAERHLVFVDASSVLKDKEGYLKSEYCSSSDGIHLTATAYDAILNNLAGYEKQIKETGK